MVIAWRSDLQAADCPPTRTLAARDAVETAAANNTDVADLSARAGTVQFVHVMYRELSTASCRNRFPRTRGPQRRLARANRSPSEQAAYERRWPPRKRMPPCGKCKARSRPYRPCLQPKELASKKQTGHTAQRCSLRSKQQVQVDQAIIDKRQQPA